MLYDLLNQYNAAGYCPMHMPGHKRNTKLLGGKLPYGIDVTEIDGFDNLHDPQGVLKETANLASSLYGSGRSFLLVNGCTAGILASVRVAVKRGDKIIMARNCHKSVYNAAELNGLRTVYLNPEVDADTGVAGSIRPEQVHEALAEHPDAKLIIVTSPTYEGVVSDIRSIADIAHQRSIPLLVDEAHGAHLGFSDAFPGEALKCGADIVVMGLHKTLPALTQCALLHVGGSLIDETKIARELAVYETSSPSYVLLASIDSCIRLLIDQGEALFYAYTENLKQFDHSIRGLKNFSVLCHGTDTLADHPGFFAFDPGKLVISTSGTTLTGSALSALLKSKYRIELEMAYTGYALAMTSMCNGLEDYDRLAEALTELDRDAQPILQRKNAAVRGLPEQKMSIAQALEADGVYVQLEEAVGMIALEYVWAYPPGVPFIVPGELITDGTVDQIGALVKTGISPKSTGGRLPGQIRVLG
jgi:arginine decarboxylase